MSDRADPTLDSIREAARRISHVTIQTPVRKSKQLSEIYGSSVMGDLGPDNKYSLRLVQEYADDVILIAEDKIRAAMRLALLEERLVIEGAAAVVVAHILDQPAEHGKGPAVAVITGDNVASDSLRSAAQAIA